MNFKRHPISSLLPVAAVLCVLRAPVWAQTTSVSGEVTDSKSAVVVGTVVKLTDTGTRQILTTATNNAGRYFFSSVTPGGYSITFSQTGFSTRRIDNLSFITINVVFLSR